MSTRKFKLRDHVRKTKGSSWEGKVVGFYSTTLTPIGYAVESVREPGSVQIYPEAALERVVADAETPAASESTALTRQPTPGVHEHMPSAEDQAARACYEGRFAGELARVPNWNTLPEYAKDRWRDATAASLAQHLRSDGSPPPPGSQKQGTEAAIRKSGQLAIDQLIDGWSDTVLLPENDDLAEYLTRIVDACVNAATTEGSDNG